MKRDESLPPMEYRPIFVAYLCRRRCRRNPSMDRFEDLPRPWQKTLWDAEHERALRKASQETRRKQAAMKGSRST